MSLETKLRLAFLIILGIRYAQVSKKKYVDESNNQRIESHISFWSGGFLTFIFVLNMFEILMNLILQPSSQTIKMLISICFSMFSLLACYYFILLLTLPILRKHVQSRTCAMLWIIPLYLYILSFRFTKGTEPFLIIPFQEKLLWISFIIWIVGFLITFSWKIISHLKYRAYVLQNASPITDNEILEPWRKKLYDMDLRKPYFELVSSPNISTPMTIGLFRRSTKVILPVQNYSTEELLLIYQHELTHIARNDHWTKLFLVFCASVCWFNPLMWLAIKKCSEDLELSCDETVLLHSDNSKKQVYAKLILETAGDERGFTTCLSAKAKSLQYRLTSILNQKPTSTGHILFGIVVAIFLLGNQHAAFAYNYTNGNDILFANQVPENYDFQRVVFLYDSPYYQFEEVTPCKDPEALLAYLKELPLCEITSDYQFAIFSYELGMWYQSQGKHCHLQLSEKVLCLNTDTEGEYNPRYYYLPSGVDFDYIYSLLEI